MLEFLEQTLIKYRARSAENPRKKDHKVYVVVFWKYNHPPLIHQLDNNGRHPLFTSLQQIKYYRGKYIKLVPDREFAVLFKVKNKHLLPLLMKVESIFNEYSSDVESHGHATAESDAERKHKFSRFGNVM